jgi:hypothetical protein
LIYLLARNRAAAAVVVNTWDVFFFHGEKLSKISAQLPGICSAALQRVSCKGLIREGIKAELKASGYNRTEPLSIFGD